MEVPHISWEYSENILVQNSARKVLKYKLGLKFLFAITLLLTKIKSIIYAFNHWRDKEETQSIRRNGRGPHLEGRQEPQASSPFRTPTAGSLQSWDRHNYFSLKGYTNECSAKWNEIQIVWLVIPEIITFI